MNKGEPMSLKEALSNGLIDQVKNVFNDPQSNMSIPYDDAIRLNYITTKDYDEVDIVGINLLVLQF